MNIFTVELQNQPGELAQFGEILARSETNMELAGVTTGDHGTVVFTASNEAAARAALEGAGIEFVERPALLINCADQPGEAGKIGRTLANANVNIEALLSTSICQGEVVFAISVDKPGDARTALGDQVVG